MYLNLASTEICNRTIQIERGTTGLITSPNWPFNKYPPSSSCIYNITSTGSVKIAFETFRSEFHSSCVWVYINLCVSTSLWHVITLHFFSRHDYVIVYDGPTMKAPILGRYCGSKLPPALKSSSQHLLIYFHTDSSVNDDGFSIRYFSGKFIFSFQIHFS